MEAAVCAAGDRLHPILMTSFAFVLGAVPLLVATGAGADLQQVLGTAVFFGMLGVTGFDLVFNPHLLCRLPCARRSAAVPPARRRRAAAACRRK